MTYVALYLATGVYLLCGMATLVLINRAHGPMNAPWPMRLMGIVLTVLLWPVALLDLFR